MGTLATAVQRTSGPSHAQVVSQSSPILFGRGAAFGLLGTGTVLSRKAELIFISTLSPLTHVRVPLTLSQRVKVCQFLLLNVVSKGVPVT